MEVGKNLALSFSMSSCSTEAVLETREKYDLYFHVPRGVVSFWHKESFLSCQSHCRIFQQAPMILYKPTFTHRSSAGYPRATLVISYSDAHTVYCERRHAGAEGKEKKKALIDRSGKTQLQRWKRQARHMFLGFGSSDLPVLIIF